MDGSRRRSRAMADADRQEVALVGLEPPVGGHGHRRQESSSGSPGGVTGSVGEIADLLAVDVELHAADDTGGGHRACQIGQRDLVGP
jgi:hypothetical protein